MPLIFSFVTPLLIRFHTADAAPLDVATFADFLPLLMPFRYAFDIFRRLLSPLSISLGFSCCQLIFFMPPLLRRRILRRHYASRPLNNNSHTPLPTTFHAYAFRHHATPITLIDNTLAILMLSACRCQYFFFFLFFAFASYMPPRFSLIFRSLLPLRRCRFSLAAIAIFMLRRLFFSPVFHLSPLIFAFAFSFPLLIFRLFCQFFASFAFSYHNASRLPLIFLYAAARHFDTFAFAMMMPPPDVIFRAPCHYAAAAFAAAGFRQRYAFFAFDFAGCFAAV